jgi:hypothetical protein
MAVAETYTHYGHHLLARYRPAAESVLAAIMFSINNEDEQLIALWSYNTTLVIGTDSTGRLWVLTADEDGTQSRWYSDRRGATGTWVAV